MECAELTFLNVDGTTRRWFSATGTLVLATSRSSSVSFAAVQRQTSKLAKKRRRGTLSFGALRSKGKKPSTPLFNKTATALRFPRNRRSRSEGDIKAVRD